MAMTGKKWWRALMLACLFWLSTSLAVFAGTITAELDQTEGTLDDIFYLTLTISGSLKEEPILPALDGVEIQSSGTSQNISIVNGQYSRETQYRFALSPKRAGTFQVPSMTVELDGKKESTLPLTFTVRGGGQNQAPAPNQNPGQGNTNQGAAPVQGNGQVFIERSFSKQNPYVGEAILCTIKVFFRVKMVDASTDDFQSPNFRRFSAKGEKRYTQVVNGETYQVVEMQEVLVPLNVGEQVVPAYTLHAKVLVPRSRQGGRRGGLLEEFFNDPFSNRGELVEKTVQSEAGKLSVQALPKDGRPQIFSGLVGTFKADGSLSTRELKVGDTTTLTLTVTGQGAVDSLAEPKLELPNGIKIYPDKPVTEQNVEAAGLFGRRIYKYALVPTQSGEFNLSKVTFNAFNPQSGHYDDLTVDLSALTVTGSGESTAETSSSSEVKQKVRGSEDNLVPAHYLDEPDALLRSETIDASEWQRYIFGLGAFGLVVLLQEMGLAFWRKQKSNPAKVLAKSALANFQRAVRRLPASDDQAAALVGLFKQFIRHRFGLQTQAMMAKDLARRLGELGVSPAILSQLEDLLRAQEVRAYGAPGKSAQEVAKAEEWLALAKEIDRSC